MSDSFKHTFAITPDQEAALASNSSVNIQPSDNTYNFQFTDDPKYTPGNISVKIVTKNASIEGVQSLAISMKWGKGQVTLSGKVSAVLDTSIKTKPMRAPGHPNSTTDFTTTISNGTPAVAQAYLSYDMNLNNSVSIKADGSVSELQSISAKSKSLVDEPIMHP